MRYPIKFRLFASLLLVIVLVAACAPRRSEVATPTPTLATGGGVPAASIAPVLGTTMLWFDSSTLIYIPEGEFTMGGGGSDEPERTVFLSGFWIYKTKVTNRMYALCVDAGICTPPGEDPDTPHFRDPLAANRPVVNVDWNQAMAYCNWMQGRLPTEAEWEKTARWTDARAYPWGNEEPYPGLLNFNYNIGRTTNVTTYPAGASYYGALDMAGNAYEWVADWYQADYAAFAPAENPMGPETGTARSVRGSAFQSTADLVPSALRSALPPETRRNNVGFRCVIAAPALYPPICRTHSYQPTTPGQPGDLITSTPTFVPGPGQPTGFTNRNCDPIYYTVLSTYEQNGVTYITIELNQPVGDLGQYTVTANGAPMQCSPVSGYPNRISCYSTQITPNAWVTITICGPDCVPTGGVPTGEPQCPPGYTLNPQTGACEYVPPTGGGQRPNCPQGYYYDTGRQTCLPIPGGNQQPQCPEGYYYSANTQSCEPRGNQEPDCPNGTAYLAAAGVCNPSRNCPEGQYFDAGQQACLPRPGGNECPEGYYYDAGRQTCLPIPGGNNTPDCPPGYSFDAGRKTCVPTNGQTPDCPTGTTYLAAAGVCNPPQECPEGQYFDVGQQTCLPIPGGSQGCAPTFAAFPGYGCLPEPGDDGACPPGYYFSANVLACIPVGGPDCAHRVTNPANGTQLCYRECPAGYFFDPTSQCCRPAGDNGYPGCQPGYYFDTTYNACAPGDGWYPDCPDGYYYNANAQTCLPTGDDCPPGAYLAAATQTCNPVPTGNQCPQGYYYDAARQTCLPVPGGNQTPQCPDGYYYDAKRQTCILIPTDEGGNLQCPPGFYFDAGRQTCLPIPGGSQQPECPPGYAFTVAAVTCNPTGNQTPDCPPGTAYNAERQTCTPTQTQCPQGYYFDTGRQTCLPMPGANRCLPGYYYDAGQQTCLPVPGGNEQPECPDGYYYDAYLQTCVRRPGDSPNCERGYYYDPNRQTCLPGGGQVRNSCITLTIFLKQVVAQPTDTPAPPFNCGAITDKFLCDANPFCYYDFQSFTCRNR